MRLFSVLGLSALLAAAASMQESPAARHLAADMDWVRGELAAVPESERGAPLARLDRAKAALDAGRPLLALYLFEMPWKSAKSWTFVKASGSVSTADLFVKKWTALGEPRPLAARTGTGRRPALLDALASAAEARGPTTYHASRFYGEDAGLDGGLYYLGESQAEMQWATFVRSLQWPPTTASPPALSERSESKGGIFLLHFPSDCSALVLPSTVPCRSSDFPHPPEPLRIPSDATAATTTTDRELYPPGG